mmetsp:Transcript_151869/g.290667  ORF Transcript_151869/g.290667 Transcript_151869/m.290667 type:complete len:104 (-) Transcript_151869:909-1220(-)
MISWLDAHPKASETGRYVCSEKDGLRINSSALRLAVKSGPLLPIPCSWTGADRSGKSSPAVSTSSCNIYLMMFESAVLPRRLSSMTPSASNCTNLVFPPAVSS